MIINVTPDVSMSVSMHLSKRGTEGIPHTGKPESTDGLVLEAWAQGFMVGSLIIMAAVTVANMRKKVLLHKLILLELILGTFHGTFIFNDAPVYGWYLSCTAIFLNISWSLHNVIAWLKTKPFLSRRWSLFYIGTVILAQPYWVVEIYANFTFFNNINTIFLHTRPLEALFRDPWWIFTIINLYWNLSHTYHLTLATILSISPRFCVLLVALALAFSFTIIDICAVTGVFKDSLPDGLNPFWKLAFVFKCLTDTVVLDDFKTALDRLMRYKQRRERFGSEGTFTSELRGAGAGLEVGPLGEVVWGGVGRDKRFDSGVGPGMERVESLVSPTRARMSERRNATWEDMYLPGFETASGSRDRSASGEWKSIV